MEFYVTEDGRKWVDVSVCLNLKDRLDAISEILITDKVLAMYGWENTDYGYFTASIIETRDLTTYAVRLKRKLSLLY